MAQAPGVLITGAARGMGAAHAALLAQRGYHVHVADIESPDEVVEQIRRKGETATAHVLDVTSVANWDGVAHNLRKLSGSKLVGLVNNAGIPSRSKLVDTSDDEWRRTIDVNLTGVFFGMRAMASLLASAGSASIVNISSSAGLMGYRSPAYAASKWGLRGLTKDAAGELAAQGIRVNSIHPGLIETPMIQGSAGTFVESHTQSIPMKRMGTVEEVARLVAFLISDESTYISGSEIAIDGGFVSSGAYFRITEDEKNLDA